MRDALIRFFAVALGLWLAAVLLPGVSYSGLGSLLLAALLLGLANAFVRPVMVLLTLPLTFVTLGLFLLVVNAAMVGLVGWVLPGFRIDGFLAALFTWAIVAVASWAAGGLTSERRRR
jgi:putative membrane protein